MEPPSAVPTSGPRRFDASPRAPASPPSASPPPTVAAILQEMDEHGYCIVENMWSPLRAAAVRAELAAILASTPTGRNSFEGAKTRRIYALFAKTRSFDEAAIDPLVLGVVESLLETKHPLLSAPTGICVGPGERAQPPHRDDGKYPLRRPHPELIMNTVGGVVWCAAVLCSLGQQVPHTFLP